MKNKISYFRKNRKMTQAELASLVGVTRQTIISIESGKYIASLELAYKISRIFNLTIEELFEFEEETYEKKGYII